MGKGRKLKGYDPQSVAVDNNVLTGLNADAKKNMKNKPDNTAFKFNGNIKNNIATKMAKPSIAKKIFVGVVGLVAFVSAYYGAAIGARVNPLMNEIAQNNQTIVEYIDEGFTNQYFDEANKMYDEAQGVTIVAPLTKSGKLDKVIQAQKAGIAAAEEAKKHQGSDTVVPDEPVVQENVVNIDIDETSLSPQQKQGLYQGTGTFKGIESCQYEKDTGKVTLVVKGEGDGMTQYTVFTYKTDKGQDAKLMTANSVMSDLFDGKHSPEYIVYDGDMALDNQTGVSIKVDNKVITGDMDIKYSIDTIYNMKKDVTYYSANAMVIIKNEKGEAIGTKFYEYANEVGATEGLNVKGDLTPNQIMENKELDIIGNFQKQIENDINNANEKTEEVEVAEEMGL